ncbi:hypothetical protein [Aristaeella lactis]|uniref:Uncharacterized protein n=1 Tax=Aristaeella lactis TaxID=3046383 RepID=A0AC61PIJ2_9FIRM|nr:hypothetical protein [Aristaeella lactis]SMC39274.1 hypothetical protein SAMN06297397_0557 [Aristaeella lactis]
MNSTKKEAIQLQTWWMGVIKRVTQNVIAEEDKRQGKAKARSEDKLADYAKREEIQEAYGYGFITEKQMDKLLDLWDERENGAKPDRMYELKIKLLTEFYQMAKQVIEDAGGTP